MNTIALALTSLALACSTPSHDPKLAEPPLDAGDTPTDTPTPRGAIRIKTSTGPLTDFDFGTVVVDDESVMLALTVLNDDTEVTGRVGVALSGVDATQYRLDPTTDCDDGLVLAPGASCDVRLYFAPTAVGGKTAALDVTAIPGGAATLALAGTGSAGPSLSISPPFADFGPLEFGHPATRVFTVTNTGPDLTINAVAMTPHIGSGFSIDTTTCGGLINGASCDVTVAFAPSDFGQDSADLAITTDLGTVTQGTNFVMGRGEGRIDVTLAGSGGGHVDSDGGGNPNIVCPGTCTGLFIGASHTLTATPDDTSVFVEWSDASCGTSPTCAVTASTTPLAITATFEVVP